MTDLEILDIIPLDKYPVETPDYFSYFGNAPLYSIVKIPLKNKIKTGFVLNKRELEKNKLEVKQYKFNLKPIKEVILDKTLISENNIQFAHWLKNAHNLSLSHAFYLILQWSKKCTNAHFDFKIKKPSATKSVKNKKIQKTQIFDKLDKKILNDLPVLIIVPQEEYIKYLQKQFPNAEIADLSLPPEKFYELIQKINREEKILFIGNKNSIFLPWQKLKKIIVYEEGSAFYKESFRKPYVDYLNLIEKFAEIFNIQLVKISSFPSLKTFLTQNTSLLGCGNFDVIGGDIEEVKKLCDKHKKIIIFSSQKITAQKLICDNCKNELLCKNCNIPLAISEEKAYCKSCFYEEKLIECKNCKSKEFQLKGVGAEWTAKYLKKQGLNVFFIKKHKDIEKIQKRREFIIIGSQNLLTPNIPNADIFLFLDFDRGFYSNDIFMKERNLRVLEFLSKRAKKTMLQTNLSQEILDKIKNGEILNEILLERKQQFLPPYSRMIKIVSRLQNLQTLNKRMVEVRKNLELRKKDFKERFDIWGPFLKKIPKKISRHQIELILRIDHKLNLKKLLEGIRVDEIEVDSYNMD